jgi:hypothetical protein
MTTKTPAPSSAAEARALADALERAERDLADRRASARRDAELAYWEGEYHERGDALRAARDAAESAWRSVVGDPGATLEDLWTAWRGLRQASALVVAARAQASQAADILDRPPTRLSPAGADITRTLRPYGEDPYRRMDHGQVVSWRFEDAIAEHVEAARAAMLDADAARVQAEALAAADQAEASVTA